jgi:hypothetical protein
MSDSEPDAPPPVVKKEKRKMNEKQMAGLRKGMEMMKAKRQEREQFEEKQKKGEIPADAPRPVPAPKPPKVVKVSAPAPPPEVIQVERKKRVDKAKIAVDDVKSELASLRAELSAMKKPAEIKEVVKEVSVPVERIVEKTKVLSGSELLNSIFFK